MKRLRILKQILIRTKAIQILSTFLIFVFGCALVIQAVEPDIHSYFDALWYCYAVITTCGFGDFTAATFIGRAASVLLSIYAVLVIAVVTGVVVNYYNQIIQIQQEQTLASVVDKLERLPELSKTELEQISERARDIHNKINPS